MYVAVNYGIGGQFLARLAQTGEVSDTDLRRILEAENGPQEAAELLHGLAESIRERIVARKKGYTLKIEKLELGEEITQKLLGAHFYRVAGLLPGWPTAMRTAAGLTTNEVGKIAEALHERGIISDLPSAVPTELQVYQDLDTPDH